jgi:ABC-2 type transport system ATP-binding protein
LIKAETLSKSFGQHKAVNNISFHIKKGEIIGFLGPNGAGKSTTMNMITGYLSPTSGSIIVDGFNVTENPVEVKRSIGYLPEIPPLYPEMTVLEYLTFAGELKKVNKKELKDSLEKIMDLVKIGDVRGRLIKNLSKGYKQRVGLSQALVGNPKLLILDEPTVGLDPKQIIEIRNLIKTLSDDHTIILSSHILPEVSAVCGRVLIMNKGIIVASDSPENLSRRLEGTNQIHLKIKGDKAAIEDAIKSVESLTKISCSDADETGISDLYLEAQSGADIRENVFYAMSRNSLPILQMRPIDMSLEDIFLNLTTLEKESSYVRNI